MKRRHDGKEKSLKSRFCGGSLCEESRKESIAKGSLKKIPEKTVLQKNALKGSRLVRFNRSPPEFSAKIVRLIAKEKFAFYGGRKGRGTPKTRSEISKDFPKPWDVP